MKYEHVLMLEDDPLQGKTIYDFLVRKFGPNVVDWLHTESEFYKRMNDIGQGKSRIPNLVISDMMMPWAWPGENADIPVPESVRIEKFRRAGFRCLKLLQDYCKQSMKSARVHWIFFTVLNREDVESAPSDEDIVTNFFVTKEEGLDCLYQTIAELESRVWPETDQEVTDRLLKDDTTRNSLLSALTEKWQEAAVWKLKPA